MLSQQELKESVINKLASLELKSDYHNIILLAFLQDLAKCTIHPYPRESRLCIGAE